MKRIKLIIIFWLELPLHIAQIATALFQIYGELNRVRLIIGEKSKRAKDIENFDKKNNKYYPYFGSEKSEKRYQALKGKYG